MIIAEEDYLEHFGVKGMKWGVRRGQATSVAKTTGKVVWKGTKTVGRGAKRAALWAKKNPKKATTIAVGALIVAKMLTGRYGRTKLSVVRSNSRLNNQGRTFISQKVDLETPFKATFSDGVNVSYGKEAEEAMRKAGLFQYSSARKLSETRFRG
jgi:hypothetical protein